MEWLERSEEGGVNGCVVGSVIRSRIGRLGPLPLDRLRCLSLRRVALVDEATYIRMDQQSLWLGSI